MAKLVAIPSSKLDLRATIKPYSLKVPGGRLVLDFWRTIPRVRFISKRRPCNYGRDLLPWTIWLRGLNASWVYSPPQVRASFERAAKVFNYQTPRDIFAMVVSGRLFLEIITEDGKIIRPIWLKRYLNR